MCGIFFSLEAEHFLYPSQLLAERLHRRGPHGCGTTERCRKVTTTSESLCLVFVSTVLGLRGEHVTYQPITSAVNDSVLCWNGEAWKLDGRPVHGNDTTTIFEGLVQLSQNEAQIDKKNHATTFAICSFIASITGPFSFVFYDAPCQRLYYGRDATGRRSLLSSMTSQGSLLLSSVGDDTEQGRWQEVEAKGIYFLELDQIVLNAKGPLLTSASAGLVTWNMLAADWQAAVSRRYLAQAFQRVNHLRGSEGEQFVFDERNIFLLHNQLLRSLHLRLANISTGNTSGESGQRNLMVTNKFDLSAHELVAILFSGGLDCTILARLAHDVLPIHQPVALLNVAFENHRPRATDGGIADPGVEGRHGGVFDACPDRGTGRSSFEEIRRVCPERTWRFIEINVPYEELQAHKKEIISLMRPHNTEMDLSIAMALYFACRGDGTVETTCKVPPYSSSAKVLLSGLGADEIFAGYSRHRMAFLNGGVQSLIEQLQLDIGRISERNLGRDDRITSHWSREVRYPYLDEDLVRWALKLPIWQKCRFGTAQASEMESEAPNFEPGKYLLRRLAFNLGLKQTAFEKKRAIQFGSRSAKIFKRNARGTEALAEC